MYEAESLRAHREFCGDLATTNSTDSSIGANGGYGGEENKAGCLVSQRSTSFTRSNSQNSPLLSSSSPRAARSSRQLIVAVTANGAECGECGADGFDEICLKPLAKKEIYRIVNRYFQ